MSFSEQWLKQLDDLAASAEQLQKDKDTALAEVLRLQNQSAVDASSIDQLTAELQAKRPQLGRFGMNLHLWSDPVYADIDRVIAKLVDLGVKYVRNDFDIDSTGKMLQHDKWAAYKPKFEAAGIHMRPMFYMRGDANTVFSGIAKNYPYFDEIEIGNEPAVATKSDTMKDGQTATEYDAVKLDRTSKYIYNAMVALLNADHPIKMITSITWTHYYFMHILQKLGANIWLSVHTYSDGFWNAANQKYTSGLNAFAAAKREFGDVVFEIGETGYLPSDVTKYSDDKQVELGLKILQDTYLKGVDVYWFELFDRINSKGREAVLGICRSDGSNKPMYDVIKKTLQ